MTHGLSLGWSSEQSRRARRRYQRVLGFNMLLHLVIGLTCLFVPGWASDLVGLAEPFPTGWVRGWGATLILVTALYLPGLADPERNRGPNLIGVAGRLWTAVVWAVCGMIGEHGFFVFAVFDLFWAVVLGLLYVRLAKAVLMSRP